MRAINNFKVLKARDYVILRLGMCTDDPKMESLGPDPIEIVVPITTAASLGLKLFESVIEATVGLTEFFTTFQGLVNALNVASAKAEAEKTSLAELAVAQAMAAMPKPPGEP